MPAAPLCSVHQVAMRYVPPGVSARTGRAYAGFWRCTRRGCEELINDETTPQATPRATPRATPPPANPAASERRERLTAAIAALDAAARVARPGATPQQIMDAAHVFYSEFLGPLVRNPAGSTPPVDEEGWNH